MHPSSDTALLLRETFENHPITFVTFRGEPVVVARELGAALGYADPSKIGEKIRGDWSGDFIEGTDYRLLDGADLAAFKAEWPDTPESGASTLDRTRRALLVLTESGWWMVAQKTEKALGVKLRRFLVEVLKKIARGEGVPAVTAEPAADPVIVRAHVVLAFGDRLLSVGDKSGAKKVWRAGASELGVDFGRAKRIEAAPTAQLELPLVPPLPAPAPASPRPKWLRDAPPDDGNNWPGLVRAWLSKYGFGAIVTSADLLQLGIVVPDSPNDAGRASRLGRALHKRIDTVIAGCRITHRNSTVRGYALQKA